MDVCLLVAVHGHVIVAVQHRRAISQAVVVVAEQVQLAQDMQAAAVAALQDI
jgi:hypothetical protein